MLPGLFIANIAAPVFLSMTGNVFIFVSMIPVEMLVLWFFFNQALKIKVGFPRLFIVTLVANTATSLLGIPLIFNNLIAPSPVVILLVLPMSYIVSAFIESVIYIPFLRGRGYQISILNLLKASFLSNLASYTIFAFVLLPVSLNSSSLSEVNPAHGRFLERFGMTRSKIEEIMASQRSFYSTYSRFNSSLELNIKSEDKIFKYYQFEVSSDKMKATVTATPKFDKLKSYRGTVFVVKDKSKTSEPQLVSGLCETNAPSRKPPEMPQLVKENFQCPPGSSNKSR